MIVGSAALFGTWVSNFCSAACCSGSWRSSASSAAIWVFSVALEAATVAAWERRLVAFVLCGFTSRNQPASRTTITATAVKIVHWRVLVISAARLRDVSVGQGLVVDDHRAAEVHDTSSADRSL